MWLNEKPFKIQMIGYKWSEDQVAQTIDHFSDLKKMIFSLY